MRFAVLIIVLVLTLESKSSLAAPDEYDDSQSHPLRIAAYLTYPAAFLLEWTIFRPFHWLVSATEEQEAVFGHRPHPPILADPQPIQDYGVSKKVSTTRREAMAMQPAPAHEPMAERVRVVEVPVEKTVLREVSKIVEIEKLVFPSVAFRTDSAELTDLGKGQVYLAAQRLRERPNLAVVIEGHTDNVGSDEYNQKLGLRRAQTVINELVARGIDSNRMSATTMGEKKPLIDQDADWARAVNRRVEFHAK
jgi:outer membrane protein OmpA-like peptidoglycan-associated protein